MATPPTPSSSARWACTMETTPTLMIDTTTTHEAKILTILAYKLQFIDHEKNRGNAEWLRAQDLSMGSRPGTNTAEGLYIKETLVLSSLAGITSL